RSDRAEVIGMIGRSLGLAIANALNVLDLTTVVLSVYLAPIAHELEPVIRETVDRHALAAEAGPVRIERSDGLRDPALRGAARAALQPVFSAPGHWIAAPRERRQAARVRRAPTGTAVAGAGRSSTVTGEARRNPGGGTPTEQTTIRRRGPARRCLEALPLGNGRLGAMAWGDPQRARFSLNESTLWSGTPARASDRVVDEQTATAAIARSRALFEQGEAAAAEQELAVLGGTWSQAFQPVGELTVHLPGTRVGARCERALDLVHAEHRVEAPAGEHLTFTSAEDDVLVHSFPIRPDGVVTVDLTGPLVE